jgi:hypothetical protein
VGRLLRGRRIVKLFCVFVKQVGVVFQANVRDPKTVYSDKSGSSAPSLISVSASSAAGSEPATTPTPA